ncbi:leucine-rich repeat protein [Crassaminicella profunda]|uniref:leucine-rich repeat protein n=1 Tax=Crassaminicella profunda TaxID=1286698 RepID=UPI001CA65A52|nr:leucine-rich repeat protein [Crassaminicella profunda]QZY53713.1 leucine-rich repeat protein [Crassaminicella profunda]
MKKIYFLITIFICMLGLTITTYGIKTTTGGLEYEVISELNGDCVKITGYTGTGGNLTIPEVVYGKPVKYIGDEAFKSFGTDNKDNITSITIPNSVARIGEDAFQSCDGLVTVNIENGINDGGKYKGLSYIDEGAFSDCDHLRNINFPNEVEIDGVKHGLKVIREAAFLGCDQLDNVSLPNTINRIEKDIFYNCKNLKNITLPNNNSIDTITDSMFRNCTSLNSISFPDNIKYIWINAFEGCTFLDNVNFNKVEIIESEAFKDCSSLGSSGLSITSSVKSIGLSAFRNCDGITSIIFNNGATIHTIKESAFKDCDNLVNFTLSRIVTTLGEGAFESCDNLKTADISLPSGLNTIEEKIFKDCKKLESVKLNDHITTIKAHAFLRCSSLPAVDLPNNLASIEAGAFKDCSKINNISIPSGVTTIGYNVFYNCTSLDTLTFEGNVTEIGSNAFSKTGFNNINSLLTKVTTMGNYAFGDCNNLTTVTIPDNVMTMGDYVFNHCDHLSQVIFMGDDTTIGKQIFRYCPELSNVKLPSNLTTIRETLFINCEKLSDIVIPSSVISIEEEAFANCKGLTSITLPDGLKTIGDFAFNGCENIEEISLPRSVENIGKSTFRNMTKLKKITVLNESMTFHDNAIESCHVDLAIHGYANSTAQTYADKDSNANDATDLIDFVDLSATPTNTAPIVANEIPDQKANMGELYSYQFPENTFTDSDGNPLTYTVNTTPAGITFDSDTRSFSGTPTTEGTVSVTITANDGKGGSVTDTFNFVVVKSTPATPSVPTLSSKTHNSITLITKVGNEYSIDKGNTWQDSNVFTHLSPSTNYTFIQRVKETEASLASLASDPLTVTTNKQSSSGNSGSGSSSSGSGGSGGGGSSSSESSKSSLEKAIDKVLKNDEGTKEVIYEVKTDKNGKAQIELSDNFIGKKVDFTAKTDDVNVTLNGEMFKNHKRNVALEIKPQNLEGSKLSKEAKKQIGDHPIYDITLKIDDKKVDWSSDTNIKIKFKVKKENNDHYKLVAVYIDDKGNVEILKDSFFDGETIKFTTKHLSKYSVMYVDKSFEDVMNHWSKEAVEALAIRNITKGTSKTTFSPEKTITRAEFVTLITSYFDLESNVTTSYVDVKDDMWYTKSVATSKKLGLLPAIYGNEFKPTESITREEMLFILHKALVRTEKSDDLSDKGMSISAFTDKDTISDYAVKGAEYLISRDIIHGYDKKINPTGKSTRAEVAQILYNLIKMLNE